MYFVSTCRRLMDTKLGIVLTYCWRLPTLRSRDQCEVLWQFEKSLLSVSQNLCPVILAGCWLMAGGSTRKRWSCHRLFYNACEMRVNNIWSSFNYFQNKTTFSILLGLSNLIIAFTSSVRTSNRPISKK